MLKVMIVDDELWALGELTKILSGHSKVAGSFIDPVEAVEAVDKLRPDVVFLDIEMPEMNGFQAAMEILARSPQTGLVFATAYNQYAVEAFELEAIDYILKPFETGRVLQSLKRVEKCFASEGRYQPSNLSLMVQKQLEGMKQSQLWLSQNGSLVRVPVADIDACFVGKAERYTTVIAKGTVYHSSQGLLEFIKQCRENCLRRCHRSCYINPTSVRSVRFGKDRTLWLSLAGLSEELMVSRQYRQQILNELKMKQSMG